MSSWIFYSTWFISIPGAQVNGRVAVLKRGRNILRFLSMWSNALDRLNCTFHFTRGILIDRLMREPWLDWPWKLDLIFRSPQSTSKCIYALHVMNSIDTLYSGRTDHILHDPIWSTVGPTTISILFINHTFRARWRLYIISNVIMHIIGVFYGQKCC